MKNKIEIQKKKLSEFVSDEKKYNLEHLKAFISFVEKNSDTYYFPQKVKKIIGSDNDKEALSVLEYFSKGNSKERLINLSFIYHGFDDEDGAEVDREHYYDWVNHGLEPINSETGNEFIDFDEKLLSFEAYVF